MKKIDIYEIPESKREELGKYIKELREQYGLGLNQLAIKVNVTKSLISKLENGKTLKINPFLLQQVAEGLRVDYKELYKIVGYLKEEDFKIYKEYNHCSKNNISGNNGNINLGEIVNSNLKSQEPNLINDLTDNEKEQVRNFINFLKSQKK